MINPPDLLYQPTCSSAQGIDNKEVPIIVFQIANLKYLEIIKYAFYVKNTKRFHQLQISVLFYVVLYCGTGFIWLWKIHLHCDQRTLFASSRRHTQEVDLIELNRKHVVRDGENIQVESSLVLESVVVLDSPVLSSLARISNRQVSLGSRVVERSSLWTRLWWGGFIARVSVFWLWEDSQPEQIKEKLNYFP